MNCSVAQKWLWAYLEGSAPARVRRSIEAHVAVCPACAGELAALRHLDQAITRAVLDSPAVDLAPAIMAAVSVEPVRWSRPARSHRNPRWRWALAAVGGAVALVGGTMVLSFLAKLWVWRLTLGGLIVPSAELALWMTPLPAGWLTRWSAIEAVLAHLHTVMSRVPAPALLAAGLVLMLLQTWAAARLSGWRA